MQILLDHYRTFKLALYQFYLWWVWIWVIKVKYQGHCDPKKDCLSILYYIVLASSNNVRTWPDFSYSFILFTKFKLQKVQKVMVTDLLYDFHVYCLKSEEICFKCIFWHTYYRLVAIISHIIVAYFMRNCI